MVLIVCIHKIFYSIVKIRGPGDALVSLALAFSAGQPGSIFDNSIHAIFSGKPRMLTKKACETASSDCSEHLRASSRQKRMLPSWSARSSNKPGISPGCSLMRAIWKRFGYIIIRAGVHHGSFEVVFQTCTQNDNRHIRTCPYPRPDIRPGETRQQHVKNDRVRMAEFTGKVAIVTSAASRIGRTSALF